jgi:uncharacterized protein with HEPN domain
MGSKSLKWLFDIQSSISEIEQFLTVNKINSFSSYSKNALVRRAVERDLAIIGEAINKIKQEDLELFSSIEHAKSIIALRNHLIHAYDGISNENIWSILVNHLPKLAKEVDERLGNGE